MVFSRVLAAAILCVCAAAAARGADLTPGTYGISSYYQSATATGDTTCLFPAGTYLTSEYVFPGYGKSDATARTFINGSSGSYVLSQAFPVTPAKGATSWSGNYTLTFLPGGTPVTGTFSSNFTVTDSKSYVATTTYVDPSNGGTCTSVVQEVGIWIAK